MPDREENVIAILMATYNGEEYISDQLDSLLAQTYIHWELFIRDDASTDNTVSIINKYVAKDKRIILVQDDKKNLGSCQNFATLINITRSQFQYFMFCDQDDFWLPFKIEQTLAGARLVEEQQEKGTPLLVYTNFRYADRHLKIIKSKEGFQSTKVPGLGFAHLLAQNPAYGCTMMMNKTHVEMVTHIPFEAENHDYWVALVASAFGKISYINKPTILYRQHNNNISTNYDNDTLVKRLQRIIVQRKNFEDVRAKIAMALAFKTAYFKSLEETDKKTLNEFINFSTDKGLDMLFRNIKNGVRRQTLSQTILFYVSIILLRRKR